MAEFIEFDVGGEEDIEEEDDKMSANSDQNSLSSFIDNEEKDNDESFNNVETDIKEILKGEYEKDLEDIENFDEISDLCESSEDEPEIDDFDSSAEKVNNFSEILLSKSNSDEETVDNNFIRVISYALRYEKEKKIEQIDEKKYQFILDLQKFYNICYEINSFLSNH